MTSSTKSKPRKASSGGKSDGDATPPGEIEASGVRVIRSYTINKPATELFRFWRNFENLPRFMLHLERVTVLDETRSHWKVKAPAGKSVEWDAQIIAEEAGKLISWGSLEGADIDSTGSVRFNETADRGTEVRVELSYIPPAGKVGMLIARLFGEEPSQQVQEDVRRFKQLMETGEIATAEGPHGNCHGGNSKRSKS